MELLESISSVIWSNVFVYLCLGAGLYFSLRSRFVQLRQVPEMVRLMLKGERSPSGVSSFQALSISLAGRVGTGNIAGVATAIAFGGPGALFWMWVMAFLGASTSFVECTLGQIYKVRDPLTGEYRGGPAYYLSRAYRHTRAAPALKVYGMVFAIVTVIAMGTLLPGVQSNSMAVAMNNAWQIPTWAVGAGLIIVLAFIIIGGVKRIANFASVVVPFMAVLYIIAALVAVFVNADAIPGVISTIISSAFGADAAFGAIIGSAVLWGVKRGIYSNESGQGSGPHAAAAAEVSHPAKQGLVQSFAVYIDTLFVCSATGFLILSTGAYRVFEGESADGAVMADPGVLDAGVEVGPTYSQAAFDTVFTGAGASFIAISLLFFCLTTLIAYYYMAETNLRYVLGTAAKKAVAGTTLGGIATRVLQAAALAAAFIGCVSTAQEAWLAGDIGVGLMAWLNIVGILLLQGPAFKALRDYERQKKQGLDPLFDPVAVRIVGADLWETRDPDTGMERVSGAAAPK
ncbi:alanine or glycine:cation symporter, AGCS family [Ruania alba]|uniref:Alanine or glycine:cation symporter, AGCS family n=1 Tax=Ruania alba TaxID=648782 RepID=A0A1H5LEM4_9MICO|nr:alanine or glycine:cation symporter, AGCS family [Ruania alba]